MTITQHPFSYGWPMVINIYPASLLPLVQFTYIQTATWLTPITCLVSQSLVTFSLHHSDLTLFCHSSWTSWSLKIGQIHGPETLMTNQPMLHKIPEGWRSQVMSFYMQSSFIIFHYTMASYDHKLWNIYLLPHFTGKLSFEKVTWFFAGKVHGPANKTVLCIGWGIFHNPEFANGYCSWLLGSTQG